MSLVIRTPNTAEKLASQIKAAVDGVRPGQAVRDIRDMREYVLNSMGDTRFMVFILTVFAGVSVLLAAVGLYGTLAYLTVQRTREFGIRLAIGSSLKAIVAIVMQETAILTLVGTTLGLLGASVVAGPIRGNALRCSSLRCYDLCKRSGSGRNDRLRYRRCSGVACCAH